jgi:hypothetical protein
MPWAQATGALEARETWPVRLAPGKACAYVCMHDACTCLVTKGRRVQARHLERCFGTCSAVASAFKGGVGGGRRRDGIPPFFCFTWEVAFISSWCRDGFPTPASVAPPPWGRVRLYRGFLSLAGGGEQSWTAVLKE